MEESRGSQADQPDICDAATGNLATKATHARKRRREEFPKLGPTLYVPQRRRTAVEQQEERAAMDDWTAVTDSLLPGLKKRGTVHGGLRWEVNNI
jgi:hypothetical protein